MALPLVTIAHESFETGGGVWHRRKGETERAADDQPAYGLELQGFDYPWPVSYFSFTSQGEALRMAYIDMKPVAPANGKTVVLFHGKNFCAATWQGTISALTGAGHRAIAVDQIGFCKSGKPAHYQFSLQQLAGNTHALLASLGISRATIIGHSVGGMLGLRPFRMTWICSSSSIRSGSRTGRRKACPGRASTPGISRN
jgi:pimeloyl-ACP methyl ester carboxylesterase